METSPDTCVHACSVCVPDAAGRSLQASQRPRRGTDQDAHRRLLQLLRQTQRRQRRRIHRTVQRFRWTR